MRLHFAQCAAEVREWAHRAEARRAELVLPLMDPSLLGN